MDDYGNMTVMPFWILSAPSVALAVEVFSLTVSTVIVPTLNSPSAEDCR